MSVLIQNKSNFLNKGFIFFISAAIHSVCLYYFFTTKFHYKIYPDKKKVVEAFIVPKETIFFPKVGEVSGNKIDQREHFVARNLQQSLLSAKGAQTQKGEFQEPRASSQLEASEAQPGQSSQEINKKNIQELTSGFGLAAPLEGGFDLSTYSGKKESKSMEQRPPPALKGLNLPKLSYPGYLFSNTSPGSYFKKGGRTLAREAAGQMRQRGRVYVINLKNYDLSPWANIAMNHILKNWRLPPELVLGARGEVGIMVVIEKNGTISSTEVVVSSKSEILDQAALLALASSSPLPVLPDDFPAKNLEVYFVFEYGD